MKIIKTEISDKTEDRQNKYNIQNQNTEQNICNTQKYNEVIGKKKLCQWIEGMNYAKVSLRLARSFTCLFYEAPSSGGEEVNFIIQSVSSVFYLAIAATRARRAFRFRGESAGDGIAARIVIGALLDRSAVALFPVVDYPVSARSPYFHLSAVNRFLQHARRTGYLTTCAGK